MHETIREGFDVFLHDGEKSFGAVRQVRKTELVVYVENAGDFEVPFSAVESSSHSSEKGEKRARMSSIVALSALPPASSAGRSSP